MWSKVIQDWLTVERNFALGAPTSIVQSSPSWMPTELFQDAAFLIEVKYVSVSGSHLYLRLETAPACEDALFLPMNNPTSVDMPLIVGSSQVVSLAAGTTWGPPIASYVRWSLDSQDSAMWVVCFRWSSLSSVDT